MSSEGAIAADIDNNTMWEYFALSGPGPSFSVASASFTKYCMDGDLVV